MTPAAPAPEVHPAAGIEPLPANLDGDTDMAAQMAAQLQADAVQYHNACDQMARRWAWVQRLGPDAVGEDTFRGYEFLATTPLIYFGRANQPAPYDFADALVPARRGQ